MVFLFPECSRPSGKEDEPFTVRVNLIPEQMKAIQIPDEHQPSVFFSLTTGKALQGCLQSSPLFHYSGVPPYFNQ